MLHTLAIPVTEATQTGEARRRATALALSVGMDERVTGRVALVVTEIATNLHLHAQHGELLLRTLDDGGVGGLEILGVDRGPGMADVDRCMVDGFSTAGTPGKGLGAIRRVADEFDVHSAPGVGTAVVARLWAGPRAASAQALVAGAVNVPFPGEEVSGDGFSCHYRREGGRFLLADGLGHGIPASTAATEAVKAFHDAHRGTPAQALKDMHLRLRATRGAAAAIADVDLAHHQIRYAGVGNIVTTLIAASGRTNMVSLNGTIGHHIRNVHEFEYRWQAGGVLVMHSDGVSTHWALDRYPGILQRDPAVIAAVIYRDHRRGRDDASVLVVKERGGAR